MRVKTAKGRKLSSTLWLERQLNDPYVARARAEGYRSRAAFKLVEIDDRFGFLKPGARVVDLGCAPGGWVQVAVARVNALGERKGRPVGRVLGIDLQPVEPIAGAELYELDFLDEGAEAAVRALARGHGRRGALGHGARRRRGIRRPITCGSWRWCEAAAEFAMDVLEPGGAFVAKVLAGGAEAALVKAPEPRLRQGPARQAAGEPEGFLGEVPGGDRVSRPA